MWPREGLGVCSGSKRGYHIYFRTMMMSNDRKHWLKACRYCDVVQQISLVPQENKDLPKIVTAIIHSLENKSSNDGNTNVPHGTFQDIEKDSGSIGPKDEL